MKIVIVGNGVAGISCAFKLRELNTDCEIVIVSKETDYFFARTGLMYVMMKQLTRADLEPFERETYAKKRIELVRAQVTDLDAEKKLVQLNNSASLFYDVLVLATGARPVFFPWRGLEAEANRLSGESDHTSGIVHFVSMNDLNVCEELLPTTRKAVVVGGGLIGIELAESLKHRGVEVTFLVREKTFWPVALGEEESDIVSSEAVHHGVNLILDDEVAEVAKDNQGRVSSVKTAKGLTLECDLLGVCIGVRPNVDTFRKATTAPAIRKGFIVNELLKTSLPDVYACGDCAEVCNTDDVNELPTVDAQGLVELFWYSAKRQGEKVAENIFLRPQRYIPPVFFNSSKFFSVEYTTVGNYFEVVNRNSSIVLQNSKKKSLLRIIFNQKSRQVLAVNVLGARVDHEPIAQWIDSGLSLDEFVKRFRKTQFDVEFGRVCFDKMESQMKHSSIPRQEKCQ